MATKSLRTVKEIRKRLSDTGSKQKDLATAAGVSQGAISQMMNGTTAISKEHAIKFIDVLGGTPEFWRGLIEDDLESEQNDAIGNLCTRFELESGQTLPLHHPDDYQDNPEAAARYMALLINELRSTGLKPLA